MEIIIGDKKKKELFISLFGLLKSASSQINATFKPDVLHVQGVDKSHVCLYELNLNGEWFNKYDVPSEENICFDSSVFYSIISSKCDEQTLVIKKENDDKMDIALLNKESKHDYNKFFKMPLIEYEYDKMGIPDTEYDAEFILPSKKVVDMLSQLSNFGDNITIICSQEYVDFMTDGDSGEMRVNIPVDDMESYAVVEEGTVELTYSMVYLSKMCLSNKLTANIEFSLSNDFPMKIKYDLEENSSLIFHIAPKVV